MSLILSSVSLVFSLDLQARITVAPLHPVEVDLNVRNSGKVGASESEAQLPLDDVIVVPVLLLSEPVPDVV